MKTGEMIVDRGYLHTWFDGSYAGVIPVDVKHRAYDGQRECDVRHIYAIIFLSAGIKFSCPICSSDVPMSEASTPIFREGGSPLNIRCLAAIVKPILRVLHCMKI